MHPDPELLAVARRVVWFKEPHRTLRNEVFFLNHAMTYGDLSDVVTIRKHFDDEALRNALRNAHPGIFDPRSWAYWHTVLGMSPAPALPVRRSIETQAFIHPDDGLSGRGRKMKAWRRG